MNSTGSFLFFPLPGNKVLISVQTNTCHPYCDPPHSDTVTPRLICSCLSLFEGAGGPRSVRECPETVGLQALSVPIVLILSLELSDFTHFVKMLAQCSRQTVIFSIIVLICRLELSCLTRFDKTLAQDSKKTVMFFCNCTDVEFRIE